MPGRKFNTPEYAYGHGGQLADDEITDNRSHYSAEYWEYDSRLGRRWNVDPVVYPWQSSYATFNNNPIVYNDPKGLEGKSGGDLKTWWNRVKTKYKSSRFKPTKAPRVSRSGNKSKDSSFWSNVKGWGSKATSMISGMFDKGVEVVEEVAEVIQTIELPAYEVTATATVKPFLFYEAGTGGSDISVKNVLESPITQTISTVSGPVGDGLVEGSEVIQEGLQKRGFWLGTNGVQYQDLRSSKSGQFVSGGLSPGQGGVLKSSQMPTNYLSKSMRYSGMGMRNLGPVLDAVSLGYDYHNVVQQNSNAISVRRLAYRTAVFTLGIAGAIVVAPEVAIVATGLGVGEQVYDGINWSITQVGDWSSKFQYGLSQGAYPNMSWFSDSTLKRDIKPIDSTLDKLLELGVYRYGWKSDSLNKSRDFGLIAQEVEEVFPELVIEQDGFKKVKYIQLISILINTIKEQQESIDNMNNSIRNQDEIINKQNEILLDLMKEIEKIRLKE